jgi:hypothetical protein
MLIWILFWIKKYIDLTEIRQKGIYHNKNEGLICTGLLECLIATELLEVSGFETLKILMLTMLYQKFKAIHSIDNTTMLPNMFLLIKRIPRCSASGLIGQKSILILRSSAAG